MKGEKRIKWILLFAAAVFLIAGGAGVFFFPYVTDLMYKQDVQKQKESFVQQLPQIKETETEESQPAETLPFEELYQELNQQNILLFQEKQKNLLDPFSYERQGIDLTAYGLEDNTIGFLWIPKMDVELPILLGATIDNMRIGAVHMTETSYPIGGNNTNCVIAAHRGYSKTAMFRDIELLELGDLVYIQNFRETLTYQVVEIQVIDPTDIESCLIQADRDLVTLLTCHPYGHNYQRYLVFCQREEPQQE